MLEFIEEPHSYRYDGKPVPSITQLLDMAGFLDYSRVPRGRLDVKRKIGKAVHLACALADLGTLDVRTIHPDVEPYFFAYETFLADYRVKIVREFVERPLYHLAFGYAGTPDRGVLWGRDEVPTTLELKATYDLQPSTAVQTAAQGLLFHANGFRTLKRLALQLLPKGSPPYRLESYREPLDRNDFLSALNTYRFRERHGLLARERKAA